MSRVIRAEDRARVIAGEVVDADGRARRIVEEADTRAEQMIERARAESESIREEARAEGATRGMAQVAAAIVSAQAERLRILEQSRDDVVRLAVGAAERVVHAELEVAPQRIRSIAEEMLTQAQRATRVVVFVSPLDLENARALKVEVRDDPALSRGDCRVESDLGRFDGRVETKLAALLEALLAHTSS